MDRLVLLVPADSVAHVIRRAEHLDDEAGALVLTDGMGVHDDPIPRPCGAAALGWCGGIAASPR